MHGLTSPGVELNVKLLSSTCNPCHTSQEHLMPGPGVGVLQVPPARRFGSMRGAGTAGRDHRGQGRRSPGRDEKLKVLKRLERNVMLSQGGKKAENSSHESTDEDTKDSDGEDLARQKTEGQLLGGIPAEVVPYRDSEVTRREDSIADAYKNRNSHLPQWTVRWMGIRKDDEFFHFVILCFAIGALLICYYYYKDWTISLGIGLITFASLETTGIYFGLVYRIRSILDSFVPLIDKFRPTGVRKAA